MTDFICALMMSRGVERTDRAYSGLELVSPDLAHVDSIEGNTAVLNVSIESAPVEVLGRRSRTNRYSFVAIDCTVKTIPSELGCVDKDGNSHPGDESPRYALVVSTDKSIQEIQQLAKQSNASHLIDLIQIKTTETGGEKNE